MSVFNKQPLHQLLGGGTDLLQANLMSTVRTRESESPAVGFLVKAFPECVENAPGPQREGVSEVTIVWDTTD